MTGAKLDAPMVGMLGVSHASGCCAVCGKPIRMWRHDRRQRLPLDASTLAAR